MPLPGLLFPCCSCSLGLSSKVTSPQRSPLLSPSSKQPSRQSDPSPIPFTALNTMFNYLTCLFNLLLTVSSPRMEEPWERCSQNIALSHGPGHVFRRHIRELTLALKLTGGSRAPAGLRFGTFRALTPLGPSCSPPRAAWQNHSVRAPGCAALGSGKVSLGVRRENQFL